MNPEAIRSRFSLIAKRVYLNAASEGPMPAEAVREAERMARLKETPWEIGSHYYYRVPAEVRARLEKLLAAPAGSVALVAGTSAGIGLAAQRLPLQAGDEVLLLGSQFPSNTYPWRAAARRGASVRVVARPLGTDPTPPLLDALGPATRVVSIDWVNFVDGATVDLEAVGSACRDRGITFVVDAAQGLGALRLDVVKAGIDILAAPSHKWLLGPVGLGFVYVAPRLLDTLQPWNAGWVNIASRTGFRNLLQLAGDPPADATRFETGSPPYSLLAPWGVSLDLLAEAGAEAVEGRILSLASRAREGILELSASAAGRSRGLTLLSSAPLPDPGRGAGGPEGSRREPRAAHRSGIVSFRAGERPGALYRALESEEITAALREDAIRISPHIYNTESDIDALLACCARFLA